MSTSTALERALPIVATAYGQQFGVKVVLSGNSAYTDGETIVVPLLDNMSELKDVLFGYLAHEAAHVRDSNFDVVRRCNHQFEKSVLNIIEDIRIELLMQEAFPGTQFTLDAMWTYIIDNQMSPPATSDDNEATQLHQYLLHRLRFEVLNRTASESLCATSQQVVEQTFPLGFFVRLDGLIAKYMPDLETTKDCLVLTRAILKALQDAEEEEQQNQDQQSSQDGQDQGDSQGDQSSGGNGQGDAQQNQDATNDQDNDQGNSSAQIDQSSQDDSQDSSQAQDKGLTAKMLDETDLPEDVVEQLGEKLEQEAQDDNDQGHFRIDASSVGEPSPNNGDVSNLQAGILTSSAIRSKLQGLLQAKMRDKQWLHNKGKRVDGKRLSRLAHGDTRVFIQREQAKRLDTAVHVLLDRSGSMQGIQDIANQATVSMAMAVSSIPKCDVAVSAFPGEGGHVSPMIARGQPVRPNLGRMDIVSHGFTPLAEAMLFAARELATSNRQRKVLIIITDGEPNNGAAVRYMNDILSPHVDTYAIGICCYAVQDYFNNWSVIKDVKELQSALFDIAGRVLDLN